MRLPFDTEQFFAVFRDYNESVWPMQLLLLALALAALALVLRPTPWSGPVVSLVLALLWAWAGVVYQFGHFSAINPLAYAFAALFLAGALAFLWQGVVKRRLVFRFSGRLDALAGLALVLYSLLMYPIWCWLAGHAYPSMPTFGLPCPTTLYTIGLLAMAEQPVPRVVWIAPLLWSLVGLQAAFLLGIAPDLGLAAALATGIVLLLRPRRIA